MKKLYSFNWDIRRMGTVEGIFVADDDVVSNNIGNNVYFGEILGKHSEIYGTLDKEDLLVLSEDQEKIEWLVNLMKGETISGYNPLSYIEEQQ